jgi:hypothetical protein
VTWFDIDIDIGIQLPLNISIGHGVCIDIGIVAVNMRNGMGVGACNVCAYIFRVINQRRLTQIVADVIARAVIARAVIARAVIARAVIARAVIAGTCTAAADGYQVTDAVAGIYTICTNGVMLAVVNGAVEVVVTRVGL